MFCPNCGKENADSNKFCEKCGYKLPVSTSPAPLPPLVPRPFSSGSTDPATQAALIGGISSMAGGGLTIFGWLLPWFTLGGLANTLLSLLNLGTGLNLLKLGGGIGNGLQITGMAIFAGFAAFSTNDGGAIFLGLLLMAFAGVMISIPVMAIIIIRAGFRTFESRQVSGSDHALKRETIIRGDLENVRSKSLATLVILVVIFIVAAFIPFGTAVLGGGYYLTGLGAVVSIVGSYFAKSKLKNPQ